MKKKITALALVVAILAIAIIGGTLAYFTDTTETAKNEFTVGNVDITLSEPNWKGGTPTLMPGTTYAKDPTVTVETGSQDCWVFMEVELNKFNSWLRLVAQTNTTDNLPLFDFVDNCAKCAEKYDTCQGHLNADNLKTFFETPANRQAALDAWFGGINHENWVVMNWNEVWASIEASWTDSTIKVVSPIVGYKTTLAAGDKVTLFTSVTMPASVTSEQLAFSRFNTTQKNWEIKITAYAIQAAELKTLDAAYNALF